MFKNQHMLDFLYNDSDIVCVVTIPDFEGRKQRFVGIADLKQEKWQKFLRAANARGSNIYLSVYAFRDRQRTEDAVTATVDRIFLDFDMPGSYEAFRKDYKPSVTINTSPGKYQVFLKLSEPIKKAEAKAISKELSKRYNADNTFDLARIFRLPGFRNRKYPEKPLVVVSEFNPDIAYSPCNLPCEELSKVSAPQREKKDIPRHSPHKNNSTAGFSRSRNQYDYSHFLRKAPLKANGDPDYSRADFSYAIYLLSQGISENVKDILQAESPCLHQRKGAGLENYLEKTIERAKMYQTNNYKPYPGG